MTRTLKRCGLALALLGLSYHIPDRDMSGEARMRRRRAASSVRTVTARVGPRTVGRESTGVSTTAA